MTPEAHRNWVERLGFDLDALEAWRFWTIPVATVFQADPGISARFATLLVESTILTGVVEMRRGTLQALAIFFLSDWTAVILRLATLAALAGLGSAHASGLLRVADTGSSAAATGTLAAVAVTYRGRARGIAVAILGAWLVYGLLVFRIDVGIVHVWGAVAGGLLAKLMPAWVPHRGLRSHARLRA